MFDKLMNSLNLLKKLFTVSKNESTTDLLRCLRETDSILYTDMLM